MAQQLGQPSTQAVRLANAKLTADQIVQKQIWEKEGYKLAENQAAIPKGADQRTFTIPGSTAYTGISNGRSGRVTGAQSYLFYKGAAAEAAPAAAPAAAPEPAAPVAQPVPQTVPGNAALSIPGIDVRLTGEQIGIAPAESKERKARGTSTGTSKLTIPRSAGASGLNIG